MKTLILIDGAAGTGKSDLVSYLAERKNRIAELIPKYTTRAQRQEEKELLASDLRFPPETKPAFLKRTKDSNFYWYKYGEKGSEEYYGFYRKDIFDAFESHDCALIVVRNYETIQTIKNEFPNIRCISVFIYTDRDLVVQRLKSEGYEDADIEFRLSRQPLAWSDYVKNSTRYDEKIINSSDKRDFEVLIENLFSSVTETPFDVIRTSSSSYFTLVRSLIGFKDDMLKRLSAKPYERNVFLMMKFRESNKLVHQFLERTLAEHGLNCVRADDTFWDITRNTYNPVAVLYCCKYGIALFDEPEPGNEYSPNVAYELGMMHTQNKECLILRHKALNSLPFDLVKELYVPYKDNLELQSIIQDWVSKISQ